MAIVDTSNLISISDASKLGVSGLVREAEAGREQVLLRNNRPVAAVVSIERLEELQRLEELEHLEEDLIDLTIVAARMLTGGPERYTFDEVLARFGYTRDQLRDLDLPD